MPEIVQITGCGHVFFLFNRSRAAVCSSVEAKPLTGPCSVLSWESAVKYNEVATCSKDICKKDKMFPHTIAVDSGVISRALWIRAHNYKLHCVSHGNYPLRLFSKFIAQEEDKQMVVGNKTIIIEMKKKENGFNFSFQCRRANLTSLTR